YCCSKASRSSTVLMCATRAPSGTVQIVQWCSNGSVYRYATHHCTHALPYARTYVLVQKPPRGLARFFGSFLTGETRRGKRCSWMTSCRPRRSAVRCRCVVNRMLHFLLQQLCERTKLTRAPMACTLFRQKRDLLNERCTPVAAEAPEQ